MELVNAVYNTFIENPGTIMFPVPLYISIPEILMLLQYRIMVTRGRDFIAEMVIRRFARPSRQIRYSRYLRNVHSWTQEYSTPSVRMARIIIALIASGLTVVIFFPIDTYAWSDFENDFQVVRNVRIRLHIPSGIFPITIQGRSNLPNIIGVGAGPFPISNMHEYADSYSFSRYTPLDLLRQIDPRGFPYIGIQNTIDPEVVAYYFPNYLDQINSQMPDSTESNNIINNNIPETNYLYERWYIIAGINVLILSLSVMSSVDFTSKVILFLSPIKIILLYILMLLYNSLL